MIAPCYIPAICVLLGLTLIPTIIHSYVGMTVDDGRTTEAIPTELAGYSSTPTTRDAGWGRRRFVSDDWIDRRYMSATDEVVLTVVRSYDLKTLYHHPELAVAYESSFGAEETRRLPGSSTIPVHVLPPAAGARSLALYVLHYDRSFVEHPIWFQLRTAGALLFSGRKQMTLFFANDLDAPENADVLQLPATALLLASVDEFLNPTSH